MYPEGLCHVASLLRAAAVLGHEVEQPGVYADGESHKAGWLDTALAPYSLVDIRHAHLRPEMFDHGLSRRLQSAD